MDTNTETTEVTNTEVTQEAPAAATENTEAAATEAAYSPNYKFKVMDEEKEMDEWLRGVIKDPDTEKKARELYEKAYGLDHVKPKYETLKKEYDGLTNQWGSVSGELKKVGAFLQNKDFGSFFETFKLTDEDIFKYALDKLEYYQLDPAKKEQVDMQSQRSRQMYDLQQENERLKAMHEQAEVGGLETSLNQAVAAPHVVSIASNFDANAGQAGAFRQAVIAHARAQFHVLGRDLEPQEAVESFLKTFGLSQQASQSAPVAQAGIENTNSAQARPKTIPTVKGGSSSPVKQQVKTLDDLRKMQAKAFETGHGHR
jgi:hypothetical protein